MVGTGTSIKNLSMAALLVCASCQSLYLSESNCNPVEDREIRRQVVEAVRPYEEFERPSDGFKYTMERHLEMNTYVLLECKRNYLATFSPLSNEHVTYTGETWKYLVSKKEFEVINFWRPQRPRRNSKPWRQGLVSD